MRRTEENVRVRPLGGTPGGPRPQGQLRLTAVVGLLAVGGLVGWVASSLAGTSQRPGSTPPESEPVVAAAPESSVPSEAPSIEWTRAATVPAPVADLGFAGISSTTEVNGTIYAAAVLVDETTGDQVSQLWWSADGVDWEGERLDLDGSPATVDITRAGDGRLLLTGRTEGDIGIWQSIPGRAIDGSSWTRVELEVPDSYEVGFLRTAVGSDGGTVTVAIGNYEIWQSVIEPYLPAGVDIDDPTNSYRGDEFLYVENASDIRLFSSAPEVVVAGDNVWVRLVTTDGQEVLQTFPLPPGTYPASPRATLDTIGLTMSWISSDGREFLQVTGRNALPVGFFGPEPWGDGFLAAVYERPGSFGSNETVTLWESKSGRAWQPTAEQPPPECNPFLFTISGRHLYLTTDDGVRCTRTPDAGWEVLDSRLGTVYVVGGEAGFVGYPDSFDYSSALFSRDGANWTEITVPVQEPYPGIMVLDDRLVVVSASRPRLGAAQLVEIWTGLVS